MLLISFFLFVVINSLVVLSVLQMKNVINHINLITFNLLLVWTQPRYHIAIYSNSNSNNWILARNDRWKIPQQCYRNWPNLSRQLEWGLQEKCFKVLKAVQDEFFHFFSMLLNGAYASKFETFNRGSCKNIYYFVKLLLLDIALFK
jgi:hypothetical protein